MEVAVELYLATLDVNDVVLDRLRATLDDAERVRADARAPERERRRFVADHGWRRELLGRLIGCAPAEIAYASAPHEAVRVAGSAVPWFSASHAGGFALYAASAAAPVGVDIERVPGAAARERAGGGKPGAGARERVRGEQPALGEHPRLAERVLSPSERAAWERLPRDARQAAFTALWARKEAHGKVLGTGLVFPLTEVTVWAGDERPVRCGQVLVHTVDLSAAGPLTNLADHVAAVAVRVPEATSVSIDGLPRPLTLG